jgi:hypothetical protein
MAIYAFRAIWQRSNKGKIVCNGWCGVRFVPSSFNKLHDVVENYREEAKPSTPSTCSLLPMILNLGSSA